MRIFHSSTGLPDDARGAAVAIGNFDGIHHGHRAVIDKAREVAEAEGVPWGVLTFEPHPRSFFRPHEPPFRLTSPSTKARLIEALGADLLFVLAFDRELARHSAEAFVDEILARDLAIRHAVVGQDFHFGRDRRGTPELLRRLAPRYGFGVTEVASVIGEDGVEYSSTRIREHLQNGRPEEAARLLGHWWEIDGTVEHGQKRGRTIGFPTANVALGDNLRPATGVYAVRVGVEEEEEEGAATRWYDGAANFGRRPTVDGTDLLLEVHLFDYTGDLYGKRVRVQFVAYIRPERKFDGLDALKEQIAVDCAEARRLLAGVSSP